MKNVLKKWTRIIKNILLDIIIILLILLVITGISGVVQLKLYNREYVDILGYSLFKVNTGSMIPTFKIGDVIIVKLTKNVNLEDIITFKKEKELITHRIKYIDDDMIITRGDNNNTDDKPIQKDDVVGKVIYSFNNVNTWKKVFADIEVIIPIIVTVILIFILTTYKEKIGENNEE